MHFCPFHHIIFMRIILYHISRCIIVMFLHSSSYVSRFRIFHHNLAFALNIHHRSSSSPFFNTSHHCAFITSHFQGVIIFHPWLFIMFHHFHPIPWVQIIFATNNTFSFYCIFKNIFIMLLCSALGFMISMTLMVFIVLMIVHDLSSFVFMFILLWGRCRWYQALPNMPSIELSAAL